MLKAGLTGGIGSGKTTAAHIFIMLGIPVYNADYEAKQLMQKDPGVIRDLMTAFGKDIYINDSIDRKRLSAIVFNDSDKLRTLNSIVHPAVIQHFKQWTEGQKTPYVVKEAALLFEAGTYTDCDVIITVTAPEALRLSRVMERDGVSKDEVYARMRNQWPDEEKIKRSDFIISNNDVTLLTPQVLMVHNTLIAQSQQAGN